MKTTLLFISVFLSANLFAQNVYIPDSVFKEILVGNPEINTNGDTEIQVSEASVFDGEIFCPGGLISDLTGIEAFVSLTQLDCFSNQLTSLDVSQNTALHTLNCGLNQLTSLDVSQNPVLTYLSCHNNQLTSLDVSQNSALIQLNCDYNQLTSLDVSQNPALTYLYCPFNQLTCLNVANGNNINFSEFYAINNPNLTCIQVDDPAFSTGWPSIDPQHFFSENCDYPSDCFTSSLTELTTSKNLIQILDMMGRETSFKPNTPLIYVYDDGTTEKVFSVEY